MATPGVNYLKIGMSAEFADNSTMANPKSEMSQGNAVAYTDTSMRRQYNIPSTTSVNAPFLSGPTREGPVIIKNVTGAWTNTTGLIEAKYSYVKYNGGAATVDCYQLIPPGEFIVIWRPDWTGSSSIELYAPNGDAYAEVMYGMSMPSPLYP